MKVRASIGTLALLGLEEVKLGEEPRTAYLLQYSERGCFASCKFCLQSRSTGLMGGKGRLGRVSWPAVELEELLGAVARHRIFQRICLQTVVKPGFIQEALEVVKAISEASPNTPISLATTPIPAKYLEAARSLGVDYLGVGLDAATEELFNAWSKPYSWDLYWRFIWDSVRVFGPGHVYVHVIVGLGEGLKELVYLMKRVHEIGGRVALFAYTDARGKTAVDVGYYRLAQIALHLLESGRDPLDYIDAEKLRVKRPVDVDLENAFYTTGCPDCNRPFYNESPGGPIYNIASERQLRAYLNRLRRELASVGVSSEVVYT